jgi:drug/metabolite transporter (DMT)-like permease
LTTTRFGSPRNLTRLALLALILFWGANFSLVKLALRDLSPLAFTSLRFLLASGVLWVFLKAGRDRVRINRLHWLAVIGLGIIGTTIYQTLFIYGIDSTLAGNASLMLATTPVFTTLLSLVFRQERSSLVVAAGVGLSVLGIALVVLGGTAGVSFGTGTLRGDLAVLVAAAAWSVYTVGSVPLVHRYGVVPVTAATMWVGTAGLLIVSLPALVGQDWAAVHPISWLAVLYSGAFAIATAYFLWSFCIRQIGSTRTAVYTNFTPVVALLVAWPALGEVPTALQAAGAGGIILGSILVRAGKIERPTPGR